MKLAHPEAGVGEDWGALELKNAKFQ